MRYKCLITDHDDTVVKSTETIHYPAFISFMKMQGRDMTKQISIEKYLEHNCTGSIIDFYLNEVGLSKELLEKETAFWRECVNNCVPKAYDGLKEILSRFKSMGGKIYVASHSESRFILRDYKENQLPTPDGVFGYDSPKELIKPSPLIVDSVREKWGFSKDEILVLDDLKHGYDMAHSAGVDFAAAGWGYSVLKVEELMAGISKYYLKSVNDLSELLFG